MNTRYVLVYRDPDDVPRSIRTWTLDAARERLKVLSRTEAASGEGGRWTIHELGPEVN